MAERLALHLRQVEQRLAAAGVETPRLDAQILVGAALGLDRTGLLLGADRLLSPDEQAAITALIARRAAREPVARILGVREFWSLPFRLGPATLEPRPDSETLVETILAQLQARSSSRAPLRLLDLGTGSGCLLLALLHELPQAQGLGLDIAAEALDIARQNAAALGLAPRAAFQLGDMAAAPAGPWDVVLSNPPYIPQSDLPGLAPELAWDPARALDGGGDGLDFYRLILAQALNLLTPNGFLALEIGWDQGDAICALGAAAGLRTAARVRDLGERERVLVFQRK